MILLGFVTLTARTPGKARVRFHHGMVGLWMALHGMMVVSGLLETLYTIFGYVASLGMILGYLPQAITTIRTHNTDGIALPSFLMMAIGALAFVIQGLLHKDGIIWSMVITS